MKKNNPIWILAIVIISTLLILNIVIFLRISEYNKKLNSPEISRSDTALFTGKTETKEECPDAKGGLEDSFLQVKYFYSPFCPWCKREEPILQRLAEDHGALIHIEWYNINNCPDLVDKYKISGVPTFVFNTFNNQTEHSYYGFIYEKDLTKLMCDVTGGC